MRHAFRKAQDSEKSRFHHKDVMSRFDVGNRFVISVYGTGQKERLAGTWMMCLNVHVKVSKKIVFYPKLMAS
jgi:hypothetical protein